MNPLSRIAVVLLAAVVLFGCGRTNVPAPPPDKATAHATLPAVAKSPGPYLCFLGIDLRSPSETLKPTVVDLSKPGSIGFSLVHSSIRGTLWDGLDNSGKPTGGSTREKGPTSSWGCRYSLSDNGVLTISGHTNVENKQDEIRREMKIEKGSTQVLLLPEENPRYVFVFCILPDVERYESEDKP